MTQQRLSILLSVLIFLTFDLMLLGAGVRTMDAGLTCPDWPLCFGRVVPNYHLGVYLEFIHRAVAGVVALIFFFCCFIVFSKPDFKRFRFYFLISVLLLFSQIMMGGLTVLKLLAPGIVTLHLSLAAAFLASLVILQNHLNQRLTQVQSPVWYRALCAVTFVAICLQIVLGGKVASTYSGSVCLDFPTCMGEWFPTFYGPIGLQVMHRLGAYTLTFCIVGMFLATFKLVARGQLDRQSQVLSSQMLLFVFSQIAIGVMNLKLQIPGWLTVVHLAVALMIFMSILKMNIKTFHFKK